MASSPHDDPGVANWLDYRRPQQRSDDPALRPHRNRSRADDPRVVTFDEVAVGAAAPTPQGPHPTSAPGSSSPPPRRTRKVLPMTLSADALEDGRAPPPAWTTSATAYYREGLERTVDALNNEADLNDLGRVMQHATSVTPLIQRLQDRGHLQAAPGDRRRGRRGPRRRHRPAPHGDHRAEPVGGRRPPIPLAAAVGVPAPPPAARVGDPAHRPADRAGRRGHGDDGPDVPRYAVDAPVGGRRRRPSARTCWA